jgi:hypothetical protein
MQQRVFDPDLQELQAARGRGNWDSDEVSSTGAVEHPGDVVGLGLLTVHGLEWCRPWSFCRTQGLRASRIIIFEAAATVKCPPVRL